MNASLKTNAKNLRYSLVTLLLLLSMLLLPACRAAEDNDGMQDTTPGAEQSTEADTDESSDGESSTTPPLPEKPANGTILTGEKTYGGQLKIVSRSDSDYVVSLRDVLGNECMSFYVCAGQQVYVDVPKRVLYLYFASGSEWHGYGEGLMFGDKTVYSKKDLDMDFKKADYEITLVPPTSELYNEIVIEESEFFS